MHVFVHVAFNHYPSFPGPISLCPFRLRCPFPRCPFRCAGCAALGFVRDASLALDWEVRASLGVWRACRQGPQELDGHLLLRIFLKAAHSLGQGLSRIGLVWRTCSTRPAQVHHQLVQDLLQLVQDLLPLVQDLLRRLHLTFLVGVFARPQRPLVFRTTAHMGNFKGSGGVGISVCSVQMTRLIQRHLHCLRLRARQNPKPLHGGMGTGGTFRMSLNLLADRLAGRLQVGLVRNRGSIRALGA